MNKYEYLVVIQGNFGYGFEDVCCYDKKDRLDARKDLKEYRLSNTGSYRMIERRVKK